VLSKLALGLSPVVLLIACGGVVRLDGSNEVDSGGIATGGTYSGVGGSTSQGAYPGRAGSGPGYGGFTGYAGSPQGPGGYYYGTGGAVTAGFGGCCLALPSCAPGDKQINQPCPPGLSCYQSNACCSSITCVSAKSCGTPPSCNPGDVQVPGTCSYPCYSVSSCGKTVSCMPLTYPSWDGGVPPYEGGPGCNPSAEYYRHYFGYSPSQCAVVDYGCPINTTGFNNGCGCGCEQRLGCPQWVDCMPSNGPQNPYCTDAGRTQCPYTQRAL
jgi:hypothetical protein